jgi:hypothetical protein
MATEVFALGYVAWLIQHPSGYFLSGYIDGRSCRTRFSVTTSRSANRLRASLSGGYPWLRRASRGTEAPQPFVKDM